jgi:2-polyprenyl-3-methyl-5-hydroxy-6-metoxy-1,4-benzoquinol methylase
VIEIDSTEELAQWYDQKYREMGGCWVTPAEECNQHLDDMGVKREASKWLLDVGCGGGYFLAEASKRVECVGMEISQVAIEECKKRFDGWVIPWNVDHGGLHHVNGMFNYFDYIVSLGSLEHIVDIHQALVNRQVVLLLPERELEALRPA